MTLGDAVLKLDEPLGGAQADVAAPIAAPAETPPVLTPRRRPIMRQYELVERVCAYDPEADEDLLNRAYVFAMKAHGSQLRASGDPYFHHPVEVAGILTGFKLDYATIATALLHDTVEDTGATVEDIRHLFGPVVARLVDGVTKLNKLELQSAQTAQAENFRKLLLAMSEDIRVLLVKLADRLHNMRTLEFIKTEEKRRRIAIETMEIYAPLAERIGMDSVRAELENLAFGHLWPDAKASIVHRLNQLRRDDIDLVQRITGELQQTLASADVAAQVTGREKAPYSIWRKMERKNMSFEQLSDIMAFRVLVSDVADCYAALGVIHGHYAMLPGRFKDFISTPKPNGYRSLHTTIIGPEKRKIEVQIRTREMHEFAELGVAAHWAYKDHAAITEGRRYRWIRELLDILEHTNGPEEFLENTKLEMYEDQVFCFSPKGDLIALPRGATPVDFAYAVHSQVGDHCVGAKVDGRMVQLRYRLQNGDQVEIITSKNAAPTAAWERFVVTGKARARIRRYLRLRQRSDFVAQGRDMMQRLAKSEQVAFTDKLVERALAAFPQKSVEDLLAGVGDGSIGPKLLLDTIYPELKRQQQVEADAKVVPLRRKTEEQPADRRQSPISGVPAGTAFHYAGCCHPVPGDPIIGVVRSGRSIAVHRADCGVIAKDRAVLERAIDIGWNGRITKSTRTRARVGLVFVNKPGALGLVSTVVGKLDANILDVRFGRRSGDLLEIALDVEVSGVEQLNRIMAALRATTDVCSVERVSA